MYIVDNFLKNDCFLCLIIIIINRSFYSQHVIDISLISLDIIIVKLRDLKIKQQKTPQISILRFFLSKQLEIRSSPIATACAFPKSGGINNRHILHRPP